MKRLAYILSVIFLLLAGDRATATLLRVPYEGVRQLGMGNAFIALADDNQTLWYNPAGLSHLRGAHFNLIDITTAFDSLDTLNRMGEMIFGGNAGNLIRTDTQLMRFSFKSEFVFPYFSVGLFQNFFSFTDIQNLTASTIDVYAFNDIGLIGGIGLPLGDYFSIGGTVKAFMRSGVDFQKSPIQIAMELGVSPASFSSSLFPYLASQAGSGIGVGFNFGAMAKLPLNGKRQMLHLAATVDDAFDTRFIGTGTKAPSSIVQSYNFGGALIYTLSKKEKLSVTLDFRNVFDQHPIIKQFHMGAEYRHKLFGLRVGLNQGVPTFGASIETPPHTRIHFASYGVELGNSLWERPQRAFILQLIIGFDPI